QRCRPPQEHEERRRNFATQRNYDNVALMNDVACGRGFEHHHYREQSEDRQSLHRLETIQVLAKFGIASTSKRAKNQTSDSFRNNRTNRGGERHRRSDRLLFSVETRRRK